MRQHLLHEFHHAQAGDTVAFVVDTDARFGTHERRRARVPARSRSSHNPLDIVRSDVLIRPQVNHLGAAQIVHHAGQCGPSITRKADVQQRVDHGLERCAPVGIGAQQQHAFGAAFGDVLVLELLSTGQARRLVEKPVGLDLEPGLRTCRHDAQPTARCFATAHVKAQVVTAAEEKQRMRLASALIALIHPLRIAYGAQGVDVVQHRRVEPEAEAEAMRQVIIAAQGATEKGQHGSEQLPPSRRVDAFDRLQRHGFGRFRCRGTVGAIRIEAGLEKLGQHFGLRATLEYGAHDVLGIVGINVGLQQKLVGEITRGVDQPHLAHGQAQLVGQLIEGMRGLPLGLLQVCLKAFPGRRVIGQASFGAHQEVGHQHFAFARDETMYPRPVQLQRAASQDAQQLRGQPVGRRRTHGHPNAIQAGFDLGQQFGMWLLAAIYDPPSTEVLQRYGYVQPHHVVTRSRAQKSPEILSVIDWNITPG